MCRDVRSWTALQVKRHPVPVDLAKEVLPGRPEASFCLIVADDLVRTGEPTDVPSA